MVAYGAAKVGTGIHDWFFNAVAGLFLASYGMPNVAIGFLANERSFIGSLFQPAFGALSDRARTPFGRRRPFMLVATPVVVLGFLILATRPPAWLVVAVFILGPLFVGFAEVPYKALLPDTVVPEQRGTVSGINVLMGMAGGLVLLVVALAFWGERPDLVFLLVAGAFGLGFAITIASVPEPPAPSRREPEPALHPWAYVQGILQYGDATRYVACYFFFWFGIGGITPFLTRFGNLELGIPEDETFVLLLAVALATLLFSVPAGWLGDRYGKRRVTAWGLLIFPVFILIGSQVQTREQVLPILVLAGIGQAIPSVLAYPLFTELVPARRMGELTGLSSMTWALAQPLGATVLGAVADQTGTLRSVLVGGAVSLLVSWAILQTVREPSEVPERLEEGELSP